EHAEALALSEEALVQVRRSGDVWLLIQALTALSALLLEGDGAERAASLIHEALGLLRDSGLRWCLPEALELAAGVAGARGRAWEAAHLFGASEAARELTGAERFIGRASYQQGLARVRAALAQEEFRAAWAEGRACSLEQALDAAQRAVQPPAPALAAAPRPAASPLQALTPRERQIAALIARGHSN